jgi:hypothetical protein
MPKNPGSLTQKNDIHCDDPQHVAQRYGLPACLAVNLAGVTRLIKHAVPE